MAFHLRLCTLDDVSQITEIYSHYVTNSYATFDEKPPMIDEMRKKISDTIAFYPWIVCEDSNKVFSSDFTEISSNRNLGIYRSLLSPRIFTANKCVAVHKHFAKIL